MSSDRTVMYRLESLIIGGGPRNTVPQVAYGLAGVAEAYHTSRELNGDFQVYKGTYLNGEYTSPETVMFPEGFETLLDAQDMVCLLLETAITPHVRRETGDRWRAFLIRPKRDIVLPEKHRPKQIHINTPGKRIVKI